MNEQSIYAALVKVMDLGIALQAMHAVAHRVFLQYFETEGYPRSYTMLMYNIPFYIYQLLPLLVGLSMLCGTRFFIGLAYRKSLVTIDEVRSRGRDAR